MKTEIDTTRLETLCEIAVLMCQQSYSIVFKEPCKRHCTECLFLNKDMTLEWLNDGFDVQLESQDLTEKE